MNPNTIRVRHFRERGGFELPAGFTKTEFALLKGRTGRLTWKSTYLICTTEIIYVCFGNLFLDVNCGNAEIFSRDSKRWQVVLLLEYPKPRFGNGVNMSKSP